MSKKKSLDYSDIEKLLFERTVIVGLKGGTALTGDVHYLSEDTLVLVTAPKSALDIETQVVHTIINADRIDYIQFKTEREKE